MESLRNWFAPDFAGKVCRCKEGEVILRVNESELRHCLPLPTLVTELEQALSLRRTATKQEQHKKMFQRVRRREFAPRRSAHAFCDEIAGSKNAMQRMEVDESRIMCVSIEKASHFINPLSRKIVLPLSIHSPAHMGCVNTIAYDPWRPENLLSGSDDMKLCLWDTEANRLVHRWQTSHAANIFGARVLEHANSGAHMSVASCGLDGRVIYHTLDSSSRNASDVAAAADPIWRSTSVRRQERVFSGVHQGAAKNVCPVPGTSSSFFSCGEDGRVLMFDVRLNNQDAVMVVGSLPS